MSHKDGRVVLSAWVDPVLRDYAREAARLRVGVFAMGRARRSADDGARVGGQGDGSRE